MRRYVLFGCGAVALGAAAWYFGRPTPPPPRPEPAVALAELPKPEAPKPLPPRVIEVIDLARAYEPVREPEEVRPGGVDPASFIQVPEAAERIPPAIELDNPYAEVLRAVQESGIGPLMLVRPHHERIDVQPREVHPATGAGGVPWNIGTGQLQDLLHFEEELKPVRLDVMPREVPAIANGLLNFVLTAQAPGELVFIPMGVPYTLETHQIPPNAPTAAPIEPLNVMPRRVLSLQDCLRSANPPSLPFEARVGVQQLDVMPREVK
jgi:hypothetical protein